MPVRKGSEGFGSDIAKIAKAVKADVAADKIAKALGYKECGCSGREESLNNPNLLVNKIFYKNTKQDENIEEQGS